MQALSHTQSASAPPGETSTMGRKKKIKPFRAVTAVKALARETIGAPPPTRRQPASTKAKKQEKHKPTMHDLLAEE